jgi:hypothetical protein
MRVSNVSNNLKLTVRIPLINHDSAIKRADYQKRVLFEEQYFYDSFVLVVLNIVRRLNLLKILPSLAIELTNVSGSISEKKFTTLVPKLCCCYVRLKGILVQFSKQMH